MPPSTPLTPTSRRPLGRLPSSSCSLGLRPSQPQAACGRRRRRSRCPTSSSSGPGPFAIATPAKSGATDSPPARRCKRSDRGQAPHHAPPGHRRRLSALRQGASLSCHRPSKGHRGPSTRMRSPIVPWSRSVGAMPPPMRPGCRAARASPSACRPIESGPSRRAAALPMMLSLPAPKAPIRAGVRSPFMTRTPIATLGSALDSARRRSRSAPSGPMSTGCSMWQAMSGNGPTPALCARP